MTKSKEAGKGFPPGGRTKNKRQFDEEFLRIFKDREDTRDRNCNCLCHTHAGVRHVIACCNKPPYGLTNID